MENSKPSSSVEKIGITTGLFVTLVLIAYFMVMKYFGLAQILELRLFNAVFLGAGVFYGINKHQKSLTKKEELYAHVWAQGMYIVAVTTITFALFMSIYISYFDVPLLKFIQSSRSLGEYINGLTIFISLLMEGLISGVIITFAAGQYFVGKTTDFKREENSQGYVRRDKSGMESKV